MANVDPKGLAQSLTNLTRGDANYVNKAAIVHTNLVDSLYNFETVTVVPTSASLSTVFPKITIPAKSIITDYGIIATEDVGLDAGAVGTKIGTTSGGSELIESDVDNLCAAGTEILRTGTGSFVDATLTANVGGNICITASADTQYIASETDVFITITTTAGFDGDGEVAGMVKYIKL
jgi:hypothetical protein